MYAVVVGESFGADVAQSPNHLYGHGRQPDVVDSFCFVGFSALVNDRSISFSYWAPTWTQADGQTWPNRSLDGQVRCASQNLGNRASGSATDRTPPDVGRGARRSSSLGGRDRHSEHSCVLRGRAQSSCESLVRLKRILRIFGETQKPEWFLFYF